MFIEVLKEFLFACSCICIIATPITILYFKSIHNAKKTKTHEEYENRKIKNWYDPVEKWLFIILIVAGIIGPLYIPFAFLNCGNTTIGNLFEKTKYHESYYVYFRRTELNSPTYKLKATIRRDKYGDGEHDFDGYYIEELHFNNGKHITFLEKSETPHPTDELTPYEEKKIESADGSFYYITLTKEKVNKNSK